jgi:serine/threonine-protein kinase
MGVVFAARQEELNRGVAIKFLLPSAVSSAEAVARFYREAQAAAALQSEHATHVYDVGHLDTGEPYFVMELLQGEDLDAMLERRGRLAPAEAVDIVAQACDAIAEAHSVGIVHRDLKPSNIFLAQRSGGAIMVKVLDFGISKATIGGDATPLTASASLMGSPFYMSPEQVREARTVDGRTDIWSLGIVLYELLTGQAPFAADAFGEICAQILTMHPANPRLTRPEVPEHLDAAVMRCLRKDPAQRFATVGELAAALRQSGSGQVQSGHPSASALPGRVDKATLPSPDSMVTPPEPRPASVVPPRERRSQSARRARPPSSEGGDPWPVEHSSAGVETGEPVATTKSKSMAPAIGRRSGSLQWAAILSLALGGVVGLAAYATRRPPASPSGTGIGVARSPMEPTVAEPNAVAMPRAATAADVAPGPSSAAITASASALPEASPPRAPASIRPALQALASAGPRVATPAKPGPTCPTVRWKDENGEIHFSRKCDE